MTDAYNTLTNAAFKYCALTEQEKTVISNLYNSEGQQGIYKYAKDKKVLPFIGVLLVGLGIDTQYWESIAGEFRKRNKIVIQCLDQLFRKLSENGVKKVFVSENFGALLAADADKALFASGDADLFGDISEKEEIYRTFEQLGYTRKERYAHRTLINTNFYNDELPKDFYFGVAWNPLSRLKLPCFINADDFVDWDNLVSYKDTTIKLPGTDALMYICLLHISLHSFARAPDIRLYFDINNMAKVTVDWEQVIAFARRDKTMVRLLTAGFLANKLLDVEIPNFVLDLRDSREYKRQMTKLLSLVYDEDRNSLRYEPVGIKILKIEALSDSPGVLEGILKILFPPKKWIRETYVGSSGNILAGYIKHIFNVI